MTTKTLSEMAKNPSRTVDPNAPIVQVDDPGDRTTPDINSIYNSQKKYERILSKKDREISELRDQLAGFSKTAEKFSGLEKFFGGGGRTEDDEGNRLTIAQRARYAHDAIRQADPESDGMPLTVDIAETVERAMSVIEEQKKIIEALQNDTKTMKNPQFVAESQLFVGIENLLRDEMDNLFQDANLAEENYQDYEKVAIKKLNELRKDQRKWGKFLTDHQSWRRFVEGVVSSKMPRAYANRGAEGIEDYSLEDAMRDAERAEKIKDPRERAALKQKARQRMMPQLLGFESMG